MLLPTPTQESSLLVVPQALSPPAPTILSLNFFIFSLFSPKILSSAFAFCVDDIVLLGAVFPSLCKDFFVSESFSFVL